ncbi:MAG: Uncharacterised protein [Opitutia bacterium UBA7350]|nr:MAG: Uncharacterised protein [Opitutae bacterium UBA7350]
MKIASILITGLFLLKAQSLLDAKIYEGFDMPAANGSPLGSLNTTLSGENSKGWHSSWQTAKGKVLFNHNDLDILGYCSTPGAILAKGERKQQSIGQAVAIRQIGTSYVGDVYGSFRFSSGNLVKDSVLGILFSIPSAEVPSPRTSMFAICPKRWGAPYGMLSAGQNRVSKIENGIECYPDETYLVIWKMENLPAVGKRTSIRLKMWILDSRQAAYFAENGLTETALEAAKEGSKPQNVSQSAQAEVAKSKRGIFKGLILSCFSNGLAKVTFDEIRVSNRNLSDALGLLDKKS